MNGLTVITVVKNYDFYTQCIKTNKYLRTAKHIMLDNTHINKSISTRYNNFLDTYAEDTETWFMFCHEDWQLLEDISPLLARLDTTSIYGPAGTRSFYWRKNIYLYRLGRIYSSNKDGSNPCLKGISVRTGTKVDTFDCQCLLVHSSLLKKYALRFDESLPFDLYIEDFCIQAKEKFGIASRVLQVACWHFSRGTIGDRFFTALHYLQKKYCTMPTAYGQCVTSDIIGGKDIKTYSVKRKQKAPWANILSLFYEEKTTKNDERVIKIFKIPVYKEKIADILQEKIQ